jgi:hypothetical protein
MILSAAVFALLLGAFVFAVLPRAGPAGRAVAATVFVLLTAVVYGGGVELLGRPKPLHLEWRAAAEVRVVGAVPVENESIYLWLTLPDQAEPRAYVLPWSLQAAQQLQAAMSDAEANGTGVRMAMPFDPDLDDREPMFYAMPQPALPQKDYRDTGPLVYQPPDRAS